MLKENEPLSQHTTWRVGGPARWFVEAKSIEEIKRAFELAKEKDVPWFILSGGSNILVSDTGFKGVVIHPAMRAVLVEGNKLTAEAGAPAVLVARVAAEAALSGLEWMATLPGTIGGAIRGNAGCFGSETKDRLISVSVLRNGQVVRLKKQDLSFSYRDSSFKRNKDFILSAVFELKPGESAAIKAKMDELLAKRLAAQPSVGGTAGCVFKNYTLRDGELARLKQRADIPPEMLVKKQISAGWLIEQVNLKGRQIGGAKVSEGHANFIENTGTATADDIVQLISLIKMNVRDRFGIQLEEEIEYFGF
jgi:UDP-N-acetylmuramate dehydrogenase